MQKTHKSVGFCVLLASYGGALSVEGVKGRAHVLMVISLANGLTGAGEANP